MRLTVLVVAPLSGLTIIVGGLAAGGDTPVTSWLLIGTGVALFIAGALAVAWLVLRARTNPPLVAGVDPATRRTVERALRDGHTDDPRVDVLVRDLIAHDPSPPWLPWTFAGLAVLQLALLLPGDLSTEDLVRTLLTVPWFALVAWLGWRRRRRMLQYRGLEQE
jgi:hypothetical protein